MDVTNQNNIIQDFVPFSDSLLWRLQQNYFKTQGVLVFEDEVPSYISTNAFVAKQYAHCVYHLIQDLIALDPELRSQTFSIIEWGSGLGKFGFYFLQSFFRLQDLEKNPVKIVYIMSDMVESNKDFWLQNDFLKTAHANHLLKFEIIDLDQDPVFLQNTKTPLIMIANYFFDCIKQDLFKKNGDLEAVCCQLSTRYPNFDQTAVKNLKELQFDLINQPIHPSLTIPYADPAFNQLLMNYREKLPDHTVFSYPIGALEWLKKIATRNNYILLTGDKGISRTEDWTGLNEHHLFSYDGCYSFIFNFDLLADYVQSIGGSSLLARHYNRYNIHLYASNHNFVDFPRTNLFFQETFEVFGADQFCTLFKTMEWYFYNFSLNAILSVLALAAWDVEMYLSVHDRLIELLPTLPEDDRRALFENLKRVEANIYYYPGMRNSYFYLGLLYQRMGYDDEALTLYQQSLTLFKDLDLTHYNVGLIYEKRKAIDLAVFHYKQSKDMHAKIKVSRLLGTMPAGLGAMLVKVGFVILILGILIGYLVVIL